MTLYSVKIFFKSDQRTLPTINGPFEKRANAERAGMIVLARDDVRRIEIFAVPRR